MGCGKSKKSKLDEQLVEDFFEGLTPSSNHNGNHDRHRPSAAESSYDDGFDDGFAAALSEFEDYEANLDDMKRTDGSSGEGRKSNNSGRSGRSGISRRSGQTSRSAASIRSGSARSGRSGISSTGSRRSRRSNGGKTPPGYISSVNMAGGSYAGSGYSSATTELRRNQQTSPRSPRSPPPPYMNIYVRQEPKPDSFKVPVSSEAFNNTFSISDNILDVEPSSTASNAAETTDEELTPPNSLNNPTPAEKTKKPAKGAAVGSTPASAAVAKADNKTKSNKTEAGGTEPKTNKKGTPSASPATSNRKTTTQKTSNPGSAKSNGKKAAAKPKDTKTSPSAGKSNSRKDSKRPSGNSKPANGNATKTENGNAKQQTNNTATSVPPPPPFSSVVKNVDVDENDKYADLLISPLTAPTMALKIQIPKANAKDDDFSAAPSLANQKRSIVTVSKRVDASSNGNGNRNSERTLGTLGTVGESTESKRVTTNIAFDDIYERGKQLGFGAFANVFLATHKPSGAKYAVKEVDRGSMVWNDKDHLQHEIDNMFKVREGPNIVQLYEVYSNNDVEPESEDETEEESAADSSAADSSNKRKKRKKKKKKSLCHLVVELMEGGELFDRIIEKRTFTEREARDSIRCVLEALKYMHDRRVVHRDLKPENLLLKLKDKSKLTPVKLADFGFAKSIKSKNGCRSLCGTPGYLAPEILERFPSYDVQCDIWSVGAILFLLLGGYLPFDDDNEEKVFDRTRNAAYDFNPRCWRAISFGAKDLISRCLTIDPRKRFTARDCLNHSWMASKEAARDDQLDTKALQEARSKGRRKMRAAVKTLMAANRLQQLNDDFSNYLEKKRQDSIASTMSYMTTGTRFGHQKFEEDGPSGRPFKCFYKIGELLGEDDYCSVHRCHRLQTNMPYDVKHVHLTNLDKNSRKTVRDEISALKLLRGGPHVVRLLDVFEERNNPEHIYLVFEAMKGGNLLSRIVEKEVYTEREARQVCKTVFTAIDYCHKKKVAHRDIKPQNVFLHEEGDDTSVRVANFGFAKRVTHENSLKTLCGTANYVAPEILDNSCPGYDQRCDIWSLGVFTYVLLGGYPPFEGVHENLAVEIMRGQYVFDEEYWGEISESAKRMIASMLQVDPEKRTTLPKALSCKWMEMEEERLVLRDLSKAQFSIRETLKPVAKVKAAVNAILARNKFLSIAGMFKHNDITSIAYNNPLVEQTIDEVEEKDFRDIYLWGSQIGIGSFSVVHEVMMKDTKEIYAAKRIDRKSLHPSDAIALHDEIAALEQVSDCDQIVKLYNHFDEPDYTFLVLECMKGGDLIDRIIEKHNYTEYDAKEVCRQLLLGVAYCHEKKIANRNLKPENLLLKADSDTDVKISDFGYAKTVTFPNSLRTQCGTEGYVAPEILEHRPAYDVSCDMWSLGVILYIVLGGYRPFRGESHDDVMRQIRYGEYKFHKRYWSHVSEDAKNLITRMLTVDPTKRITAETALRNRWIQADEMSLGGTALSDNMKDLKNLRNAKRKVKAATRAIIATNKLQSIGDFRAYQDF